MKTGPLTKEELMALWKSVTDETYNSTLLSKDNSNIAIIEQAAEQFAAVSRAIDENTQSLFILPWSGQTAPPASGEQYAEFSLSVKRVARIEVPLVLTPNDIVVEQQLDDYGENGAVTVSTGRRYTLKEPLVFMPGEAGPKTVQAIALQPGSGYNHPTPGTINKIVQVGSGFNNIRASVVNTLTSSNQVIAWTLPDVPVPEHIGQYLVFTQGANVGSIRRVVGVAPPTPDIDGGVFYLAAETLVGVSAQSGTFIYGERVRQNTTNAYALFLGQSGSKCLFIRLSGTFVTGFALVGERGATANVQSIAQTANLESETLTASWRIASWDELGLVVWNEEQPTGGRAASLDALGYERNMLRFLAESDDQYRERIARPSDVISPNAIVRAGNRVLIPYEESVCLREVGRPLFQGMFFDGAPTSDPFAFDLDAVDMVMLSGNQIDSQSAFFDAGPYGFADNPSPQTAVNAFSLSSDDLGGVSGFIAGEVVSSVNSDGIITMGVAMVDYVAGTTATVFRGVARIRGPGFEVGAKLRGHTSGWEQTIVDITGGLRASDRFNVMLDLVEHRGFFLLGVPRLVVEDFGVFFDAGVNPFDATTLDNFYDGRAIGTNSVYSRIWSEIARVRGGGVRADLYIEDIGCV